MTSAKQTDDILSFYAVVGVQFVGNERASRSTGRMAGGCLEATSVCRGVHLIQMAELTVRYEIPPGVLRIPVALFAGFLFLFAAIRSRNIFAVDGAHRCLQVWHRQTIFLDGSNHMLYPVNVFAWARLASALGYKPSGPLEFFSMVELMNCVAGAACLAIFCLLMYLAIPSWRLATVVTWDTVSARHFSNKPRMPISPWWVSC